MVTIVREVTVQIIITSGLVFQIEKKNLAMFLSLLLFKMNIGALK